MKKILFLITILFTTPLIAIKPEINIQDYDYHITFEDITFTLRDTIGAINVTTISAFENILIITPKNKPQPSAHNRTSILTRAENGKMVIHLPYAWGPNMTSDYIFTIPEGIIVEIKDNAIWLAKYKDSNDLLF